MIDIGLNLASPQFNVDRCEIIQKALKAGVEGFILTGTDVHASQNVLKYSIDNPAIMRSTFGVHPHNASTLRNGNVILEKAKHENVVAIGECGLDYDRLRSSKAEQIYAFELQLDIARALNKPVFLHVRPKIGEESEILKDFFAVYNKYNDVRGVVHCFTGNQFMLETFLDYDFYVGITGWVTDKRRGVNLVNIVKFIPENRLMVETDAPYLTPHNMPKELFKRRNEPSFLIYVLNALSEYTGFSMEELKINTNNNVFDLFEWKPTMRAEV